MLRSVRILKRVQEWWEKLSLRLLVKNHQFEQGRKSRIIIICQQMVYAQPRTCPRKWFTQTPVGLWYTNGSPNLGPKTRSYNIQQQKKKKRICKIVDFAVPADHRIKLKECEKRDKYLDLARDLKKLWNMKVTIIPIVIGDRVDTIQTTALLKTARILRRVLKTWGDLLSLNLQWNTISLRWCENSNE